MHLMSAKRSRLVIIDFQARLMPAIHDGPRLVANAGKLVAAAKLLEVPIVMTEQNPAGQASGSPAENPMFRPIFSSPVRYMSNDRKQRRRRL